MGSVKTAAAAKSLQSCPTLCGPIDGSPPGSAVPGILQARTLEWVGEVRETVEVGGASRDSTGVGALEEGLISS